MLLILAAVAIPMVANVIGNANEATNKANLKNIETAIKYAQGQNAVDPANQAEDVAAALALSGLSTDILTGKAGAKFAYSLPAADADDTSPTTYLVYTGDADDADYAPDGYAQIKANTALSEFK